jgi:hypothetical protein
VRIACFIVAKDVTAAEIEPLRRIYDLPTHLRHPLRSVPVISTFNLYR